ncbi:MAG TPA: hypothetical protein ENF62_02340 [Candidatus Bathyarchaeota archaeon]|nr:hypothetical protein [Candidatus Bathyarchaeota archaeon]
MKTHETTLLLLAILSLIMAIPTAQALQPPKTYAIWELKLEDQTIIRLQVIPDLDNDGVNEVFIASSAEKDSYLYIVSGKNGTILRTSGPLGHKIRDAVWVSGYVAASAVEEISIFDYRLIQIYTLPVFASLDVRLQPLGNLFVALDIFNEEAPKLVAINPRNGQVVWSVQYSRYAIQSVLTFSGRVAVAFTNGSGCFIKIMDEKGEEEGCVRVLVERKTGGKVYISSYRDGLLFFRYMVDEEAYIGCISLKKPMRLCWMTEVDPHPKNLPFALGDANIDGIGDVVAVLNGKLALFSGKTGELLYSTGLRMLYAKCLQTINEKGDRTVLMSDEGRIYLLSFGLLNYSAYWVLGNYTYMESLGDVDGDGLNDIAIIYGGTLSCFWGGYDQENPRIHVLEPKNATSTSNPLIVFRAEVEDKQSGVKRVLFVIDGEEHVARYNPSLGVYEVGVILKDGTHRWSVHAVDRVGHDAYTPSFQVEVNTSLMGGPGWADDIAVFFLTASLLVASLYVGIKRW